LPGEKARPFKENGRPKSEDLTTARMGGKETIPKEGVSTKALSTQEFKKVEQNKPCLGEGGGDITKNKNYLKKIVFQITGLIKKPEPWLTARFKKTTSVRGIWVELGRISSVRET